MPGVKGQIQKRGVERRKAIIDAAAEQFARDGYRGAPVAAIAEQAGVTTGGLLHHFGTKEDLLVAVLTQRDEEAIAAFDEMGSGSAAADFALWVDIAAWNEERADLTALFTTLQAESIDPAHPTHAYFRERNQAVTALVEHTLRTGIESGELTADIDVAQKTAEVVAFMEGASLVWLSTRRRGALRSVFDRYFTDQLRLLTAT